MALGVLAASVVFASVMAPDILGLIDGSNVSARTEPITDSSGTYFPASSCWINGLQGHEMIGVIAVISFFAMRKVCTVGIQNGASRTAIVVSTITTMALVALVCSLIFAGAIIALRLYGLHHGGILVVASGTGFNMRLTADVLLQPYMVIGDVERFFFATLSAQAAAGIAALASLGSNSTMRMIAVAAIVITVMLLEMNSWKLGIDLHLYLFYFASPALALMLAQSLYICVKSFKF